MIHTMFSTRSSNGIGLYTISWTSHTSPWTHWKSRNIYTQKNPHFSWCFCMFHMVSDYSSGNLFFPMKQWALWSSWDTQFKAILLLAFSNAKHIIPATWMPCDWCLPPSVPNAAARNWNQSRQHYSWCRAIRHTDLCRPRGWYLGRWLCGQF